MSDRTPVTTRTDTTASERSAAPRDQGVSKYFGSVIALQDISMFVRAGEVTCLLGDNGAGKSTLIKTLSGVYTPDEGEYLFEGEPHGPSARRATR